MRRKGVLYDVGRVMGGNWRPDYDPHIVRRELQIIAEDLHCTAVKICGRDSARLVVASEAALEAGLEVWFSPELWNRSPAATLEYINQAAVTAGKLRTRWPGRVVFSVGTELSFFMRGILEGATYRRRTRHQALRRQIISGVSDRRLNAFLSAAAGQARRGFTGPITYASLPFERVDWTPFDVIGIDHYWMRLLEDRYLGQLEPLLGQGKPVVITELGFRTRTGADQTGPMGPENFALVSTAASLLVPPARRFLRPRVRTINERNEQLQAQLIRYQLQLLYTAGVDGAFVHTFVTPIMTHGHDPRHDLDTDSFSIVKSYPPGEHGATYPDMTWEPKEAFHAIADYYANH